MALGQILRDFSGWTSAHGIPHVGSAQNWCLKVFWSLVVLSSVGLITWQLYLLFAKFFKYEVDVAIELKFEARSFPAVTVCNLNPYKLTVIQQGGPYQDILRLLQDYEAALGGQPLANDTFGFAQVNGTATGIRARANEMLPLLAAALREQDPTAFEAMLYTRGDVVQNCAYDTKPCNQNSTTSEDFLDFFDPVFGQCFTFNPKEEPEHKSTRAGPIYGLRLLMMANQSEYLPTTDGAGVKASNQLLTIHQAFHTVATLFQVSVHGQDQDPFPDAFGYNAATGFTTSFGIKFVNNVRKMEPFGNCTDDKGLEEFYYTHYSMEGCFRSCFQRHTMATCSCRDPRFEADDDSTALCGPKEAKCLHQFTSSESFNPMDLGNCKCVPPCEAGTYGLTVSTARWPSEVFVPGDCKRLPSPFPTSWATKEHCIHWYHDNTLLIEVYYERMNFQEFSEREAYAIINLVSDMGSQLGLWMGISVITVTEFLSLGLLLCCYVCARSSVKRGQKELDDQDSDDED